jgi:hypothetical protein
MLGVALFLYGLGILAFVVLLLLAAVSALRDLRDVPSLFCKHLSRCWETETKAIAALQDGFSLPDLERAEGRLSVTIAQLHRRLSWPLPLDKLAVPSAVLVSFFYGKPLLGAQQGAASWPAELFIAVVGAIRHLRKVSIWRGVVGTSRFTAAASCGHAAPG